MRVSSLRANSLTLYYGIVCSLLNAANFEFPSHSLK
jgi:hypothetical protein